MEKTLLIITVAGQNNKCFEQDNNLNKWALLPSNWFCLLSMYLTKLVFSLNVLPASSRERVYPFLRCFLWLECSRCHLCLLKSYPFFTPGLKGCLPWSLFGPTSQNYFLPLCPQAVFGRLSFIVLITFHDVYNYLSTYVVAFLSDTSQKTRTIPCQEINIWSLNETKQKKIEYNTCAYSDVAQIDKKKVLFVATFF